MVVWHYIHNLNDKCIQINIKSDIILKIQFCITCFCIVNDKAYPNFCLITIASSWLGQLYVMANNINISNKKGTTWYFLQIFVRFKALDTSVLIKYNITSLTGKFSTANYNLLSKLFKYKGRNKTFWILSRTLLITAGRVKKCNSKGGLMKYV